MRYKVVFRCGVEDSGKASGITCICGGRINSHQTLIDDNRCEREASYSSIDSITHFINKGFKEFGNRFEIMHIYLLYNLKGGSI